MKLFHLLPAAVKRKLKLKLGAPHMYWSLENLKRNGFKPKTILDIGAYEGEFSAEVATIFPEADCLLFEANAAKKDRLLQLIRSKRLRAKLFMECLGATMDQEVGFHLMETASSVLDEHVHNDAATVSLKTKTLDHLLANEKIQKVDLIKLDVQGYELEILKGFSQYIVGTDVILTEVSLLDIHKGVPLMRDVINYVYQFGFVPYDICSVSARRPLDKALWQTDLIFVKEDSIFRSNKNYGA